MWHACHEVSRATLSSIRRPGPTAVDGQHGLLVLAESLRQAPVQRRPVQWKVLGGSPEGSLAWLRQKAALVLPVQWKVQGGSPEGTLS